MEIQIITYDIEKNNFLGEFAKVTQLAEPDSFDSYDVNIIDLAHEDIWIYRGNGKTNVDCVNDLINLGIMIDKSMLSKTVVILPQNQDFYYYWINSRGSYSGTDELRYMTHEISVILKNLHSSFSNIKMYYENTETKIGELRIPAAFCFDIPASEAVLTKSLKSEKVTTMRRNGVIFTTLKLDSFDKVQSFLKEINIIQETEKYPEWMNNVKLFNDDDLLKNIKVSEAIIQSETQKIESANNALNLNNHYKSVLYTQSDELVSVVFEIIEEMLGFDFSEFEDKHNEDFLYETDDVTYIGEIKGVSSNVRSEHVSQLDTHYYTYLDDHPDMVDKTKAWLIMNHQRKQPLEQRKEVHETQIKLAERNGSLIIETYTLLKLFEKYRNGEKTSEECLALFSNKTGILTEKDIE